MTNQTNKPSKKMAGDSMIGWALGLVILAVLAFILGAFTQGETAGIGVLLLVGGFAFAVIGYLQRIAAKK